MSKVFNLDYRKERAQQSTAYVHSEQKTQRRSEIHAVRLV